jgi:hypothetical protein
MVSIVQRQHLVQTLTFKRCLIGIYFVIFAAFVRIQNKRRNTSNGPLPVARAFLIYLVSANFFACTAYLAVDITAYRTQALGWILASNALYTCIDFFSQVILVNFLTYDHTVPNTDASGCPFSIKIYRCWMMWRQPWVMVVPIVLILAFLGANLHNSN